MTLLVTRARTEADALVATLRRRGVAALAAPCLEYSTLPVNLDRWRGHDADLLITSPRAVGAVPALDPAWRLLALAPETRRGLEDAGLRVDLSMRGGAAELASAARAGPVLHLTSNLGGDEVRRVRPDAWVYPAYITACPESLPAPVLEAVKAPYELLFFSPSAVRHLEHLLPGALAAAQRVWWFGDTTRVELAARGITGVPWKEDLAVAALGPAANQTG